MFQWMNHIEIEILEGFCMLEDTASIPRRNEGEIMQSLGNPRTFLSAINYLSQNDQKLAKIIKAHGRIKFKPQGEMFESLVESILGQQLAGAAADAIIKR